MFTNPSPKVYSWIYLLSTLLLFTLSSADSSPAWFCPTQHWWNLCHGENMFFARDGHRPIGVENHPNVCELVGFSRKYPIDSPSKIPLNHHFCWFLNRIHDKTFFCCQSFWWLSRHQMRQCKIPEQEKPWRFSSTGKSANSMVEASHVTDYQRVLFISNPHKFQWKIVSTHNYITILYIPTLDISNHQ